MYGNIRSALALSASALLLSACMADPQLLRVTEMSVGVGANDVTFIEPPMPRFTEAQVQARADDICRRGMGRSGAQRVYSTPLPAGEGTEHHFRCT
ncbi:MAG: hypothetical protein ACK4LQ_15330 [Pararhodobacter sp.]